VINPTLHNQKSPVILTDHYHWLTV